MKKTPIILTGVLALCLTACNQDIAPVSIPQSPATRGDVTFTFDDGSAATRSTTAASETAVNSLQICVFNSSGTLDACGNASSNSMTLSVSTGQTMTVYAVVNSSVELAFVSDITSFRNKVSYLEDNSLSELEMIGSVSQTLSAGASVTIPVTRNVAKVELDAVTPAFTSAAHSGLVFKIKSIYLINACGSCDLTQTPKTDLWYNKTKYVAGDFDALLYDSVNADRITASSPYRTPHYFYAYPNSTTSDTSSKTWSPRYTRLVVETSLGGTTYYYPINIIGSNGKMDANHLYRISNLKITGLGSTDPDIPLKKGAADFTVTVVDWENGFNREETL